jgi:hypothetical protein
MPPARPGPALAPLLLSLAAGCSPFPDLDDRVSPGALEAPYPELVATEPLVAAAGSPGDTAEGIAAAEALEARAAAVQARAAGLQGPVIEPETRARLDAMRPAR